MIVLSSCTLISYMFLAETLIMSLLSDLSCVYCKWVAVSVIWYKCRKTEKKPGYFRGCGHVSNISLVITASTNKIYFGSFFAEC